ncbi:hypothetical protein FRX31_009793, partial [Thalictrum thalictroides]
YTSFFIKLVISLFLSVCHQSITITSADLATILPRVLIVSRRTVRKNKFVNFIGEYHLDLIVGEDIDPSLYEAEMLVLSTEELEEIRQCHASDTAIDQDREIFD